MASELKRSEFFDVGVRFKGEEHEIILILYVLAALHDGSDPWNTYRSMQKAGVAPNQSDFFALWSATAETLRHAGRIFRAAK